MSTARVEGPGSFPGPRFKSLGPEWLPAVALSTVLTAGMVAWNPQVGDLAAQVFRTELFRHVGLAIWNGSWYGGLYILTYSVLFPPLAALIGLQAVGALAVVASSYFFDRIVRYRWGSAARWATLWFAAGVVTLLASGQLTFALGVAPGLCSLRALQTGHPRWAALSAALCALSSPVAAAFLAGVVLVGTLERGRPFSRGAAAVVALALGLILAPNLAFPEAGQFPFSFSSFIAIPLWCGSALYVTRGLRQEERQLRWVIGGYLIAATIVWLTPNAMGGNAVRLGALFGGPVLAAVVLAHRPRVSRWVLALFLAGSLYWQVGASVAQVVRSADDPSTEAAYFRPLADWLRAHGGRGTRIEVPPTADHWESAYLAPEFDLGRGWLRQLDTTRDDIFYDEGGLTDTSYRAWLRDNAIRYVALPDAPVDYSAAAERRVILSHPPYLELRWSSAHWQVYAVRHPKPLIEALGNASASTRWLGHQGFGLDITTPGAFLVRVSYTPYWSIERGEGCLSRRGTWTLVHAHQPGPLSVTAEFSLGHAWGAVSGAKQGC